MSDLNQDGRMDCIISNNVEPVAVLLNTSQDENHWIKVRLVGRKCRDAIGASMVLTTSDGRKQLRLLKGGGSYLSQNEAVAFWGVPSDCRITELSIRWPGGEDVTKKDLSLDKSYTFVEP